MSRVPNSPEQSRSLLKEYSRIYADIVRHHKALLAKKSKALQPIKNTNPELQTPLNAIIGFSKLLKESKELNLSREKIVEYSEYINDTAEHLLKTINHGSDRINS